MIPLSYAQRRLWFLSRLEGSSASYNVPLVIRLAGVPDTAALAAAVQDLLDRHEVLRAVVEVVDGEPVQRTLTGVTADLRITHCSPGDVDGLLRDCAAETFDLAADAPLRIRLLIPGPDKSVLVILLHHIATDGASTGPLLGDLAAAYQARRTGRAPSFEPLPVQYADYTLWQRELLGEASDPGSLVSAQLDFWREALDGAPQALDLPADRPRPAEPSHRGGLVTARLDADLHRRLAELGRTQQASLFMVLQAGLAAALAVVGAGDDVLVGVPTAGRPDEALQDLVGFFVNTLVLRSRVPADLGFAHLVGRVRDADLAAYAHEDLPFDLLVEHLNPLRSLGSHPFFQVMLTVDELTVDPAGQAPVQLGDLTGQLEPTALETAKFDLTVFCTALRDGGGRPGGVEVWLQYASDLFDEGTAQLLADVYVRVLAAVAADPAAPVGGLEVLSAGERQGLDDRRDRIRAAADSDADKAAGDADGKGGKEAGAGTRGLTPRQEILCGLMADVLGAPQVGLHDNFFRIGGHSLLGVRLVNRVRSVLGAEVGIRDLFLAPTVAGLDQRIEEAAGAGSRPVLAAGPRPERVPLSFAQGRLWFLDQLGAGTSYNVPVVLRLEERLEVGVLRAVLADLAERHEVLRTVVGLADGEPVQVVMTGARPELRVVSVTEEELAEAVEEAAGYRFDLAAEIPLRAWLLKVDDGTQVLVLLVHHIAGDGWSMGPLLGDLAAACQARAAGRAPRFQPLPVQYADYALWQRELLGEATDPGSVLSRELGFWREALDGAPPVLDLPADRPRPAVASGRGGVVPFEVDAQVHARLAAVARECGATLFMVLQSALAVLVTRMGAGTDVPIGTVVAGRGDEALEDLVGFFVNTLVLRTDTGGNPAFGELIARVRDTDLAAYAHQDLPFERLVEELNPARSTAHHPLVQVTLVLQNTTARETAGGVKPAADLPFDTGTAKYDLTLGVREQLGPDLAPRGISGVLEFATDLFDPATARALAACLERILRAVADDPEARIADIDLLPPGDRQDLEGTAGGSAPRARATAAPGASLTEAFEAQVVTHPDSAAVAADGHLLSYRALDAAARALASRLADSGVGRGDVVGVLLERGSLMITAALAVLKAGGAYFLLDPDWSDAQLTARMAAASLDALITAPERGSRARRAASCPVLLAGDPGPGTVGTEPGAAGSGAPGSDRPRGPGDPADAASVVLTAGTSGEPKPVLWSRTAVSAAAAGAGSLADDPGPVWLLFAPVSSGEFSAQLWAALLSGATCVVAPAGPDLPGRVAATATASHVSTLVLPGGLFAQLADEHPNALADLRRLVITGERPPVEQLARVSRQHPGLFLGQAYGLAEAALFTSYGPVTGAPSASAAASAVPAGRPAPGQRCYVLDDRLHPMPAGLPGELYIAGSSLATGYHRQPGQTAAAFVADPFGPPGARMHRTGDLARWTAEGALRVCGRAGDQPRVNGYRVSLSDVAAALGRGDSVSRAAAVLRPDHRGHDRLVGYVVPAGEGAPVTAEDLLRHFARELPDYLVPADVVTVAALPLTAAGRVDLAALPAAVPLAADRPAGPRSPREQILCELFAEVLDGRPVGIDDNFFRIGGHSLLAVRLANRIRSALNVEISIMDVFQAPSVAALAERLPAPAGGSPADAAPSRPALRPRTAAGARLPAIRQ